MASKRVAKENLKAVLPFLTAWDPTDLPGGSVDPLGFDRGYNALADKILPGLTNVASHPRYLSLLCAGASLGPEALYPNTDEIHQRQNAILRLERYWALAQVLAAESGTLNAQGVRGVRYAEAQRNDLARTGARSSGSDFLLLTRQVQYGCLGIYGNVASGMGLIHRKTLGLTAQFGDDLGTAFIDETDIPRSLCAAVRDGDAQVGLDVLRSWGERSHIAGRPRRKEAELLGQALDQNPIRKRMTDALARMPADSDEPELDRLNRIARKLPRTDQDLVEAIVAILAYEKCYRLLLLALDRLLWRCAGPGGVRLVDLGTDDVLKECASSMPAACREFENATETARTEEFKVDLDGRLKDVRAFLAQAAVASGSTRAFVETVLARHTDVQHGKFDQGRRKLPWLETVDDEVRLTTARANLVAHEPRRADDVPSHAYRTGTADALWQSARGQS